MGPHEGPVGVAKNAMLTVVARLLLRIERQFQRHQAQVRPAPAIVAPEAAPSKPATSPAPALTDDVSPAQSPAARRADPAAADRERSTLAAELALLSRAQQALREREAARALALFERHRRSFPQGVLAEEREVGRVTALCALGQSEQARRAAQRFAERFADSASRAHVESLCAP